MPTKKQPPENGQAPGGRKAGNRKRNNEKPAAAQKFSEKDRPKEVPEEDASQNSAGRAPATDESEKPAETKRPFPVVGIGASAGGLEALEVFFEHLPVDSHIAFVVITHTDPKRSSLLPKILERKTKVTVKQVKEGMPLAPDTIFLPPSDSDPVLENEIFHLHKRQREGGVHMPVDLFLRNLAAERGQRCGCVILSGTGSDGTHGLRAVKEMAGLTMAQDPQSARHTGMPASAIETGLVDFVEPPEKMARRLIEYFTHPVALGSVEGRINLEAPDKLKGVIRFLAERTRHDFSLYKSSTLNRRIARRLAVTRSRNESEYLKLLHRDHRELQSLFQDLLIGVTSFFRDPEAFSFLKRRVLPDLFGSQGGAEPLRVWVPGCASGEEAYSVAILFKEYMAENSAVREFQIFGTDIDARAIEKARGGRYLENIAADLSAQRLERFFEKAGGSYRVKREIRDPVVFAEQNLLRDPPFSDLNLLMCRNLLIYLKTEAQDRLIPLFHHVLKKNGVLFLGNSETIGRFPELFEPLGRSHSIFRRKESAIRPLVRFPTGKIEPAVSDDGPADGNHPHAEGGISMEKAVESILIEGFTPTCVVVNPGGQIVYTRGRTGRYLELAPGQPNLIIADMAREGLRFPLRSALRRVKDSPGPIREEGLRVKTNGGYQWIDLTVQKFSEPHLTDAVLVIFAAIPTPLKSGPKPDTDRHDDSGEERLRELEQELLRVSQEGRSVKEELESSNEELRSSNEEMQSSNEELQSTNEELESSREELQSLNEELSTVNDELQNKIQQLDDAYRAVTETLDSTRIAIVFLDKDLCVQRFTHEATRLINLIDSDLGRPLAHISDNLEYDDGLATRAATTLKDLSPFEDEVSTHDGHWYHLNVMVHRKEDHIIEGVVLTFVNIDSQKGAQQEIAEIKSREVRSVKCFAESIVETVRESLLVLDAQLRVLSANRRFYTTFNAVAEQTEGKSLFELGNGQWDTAELRALLQQVAGQRQAFEDYRLEHPFPDIGLRKMVLNARHLEEDDETGNRVLLAIEDVTAK